TRFAIDASGRQHMVWGSERTGRVPPVKYTYGTDASSDWAFTEFDEQCFHDRVGLVLDGTEIHITYVRPRNLQAVYYYGPGDSAPRPVIDDARGGFGDAPLDQGTAVAVDRGTVRLAFVTSDGIYLASE